MCNATIDNVDGALTLIYLYLMIAFFLRCSSSLQSLKRTPSPPVRTMSASTRPVAARVRGSVRAASSECGGWVWCRPRPGTSSWGACLQPGLIEFFQLDCDILRRRIKLCH